MMEAPTQAEGNTKSAFSPDGTKYLIDRGIPLTLSRYCRDFSWTSGNLNNSTYRAFCKFAGHVFNQHSRAADNLLREVARLITQAGDSVKAGKLIEQFRDAFAYVSSQRAAESLDVREFIKHIIKWPDPEPALIEKVRQAFGNCTLAWWEESSFLSITKPGEALPVLFPPESLVCYGPKKDRHLIREIGEDLYRFAARSQYVVPNPARAPFIDLPGGKRSKKCKENFPLRRFLVIEFDRKKIDPDEKLSLAELLDLQAKLHAHLETERAPLAMLVYSGSISLHGWYPTVGVDDAKALAFLRYACRLGADHNLQAKSFFTRMPGGLHENGTRQTIHYFNPETLPR
jgi:hypothetical protein